MLLLYLSFSIKLEMITLLLKCASHFREEEGGEEEGQPFEIWTVILRLVGSGPPKLKQQSSMLSVSHNTTSWRSVTFVKRKPKIYDCL